MVCLSLWLLVEPCMGAEGASLGFEMTPGTEACGFLTGVDREDEAALPVVIPIGPETLKEPGPVDVLLDCAEARHLTVVARLEPPVDWQREADRYAAIASWLADMESFLQSRHGRLRRFELARHPEEQFEPDAYLFLLEKISTMIRSFDPGALMVVGPLGEGAGPWLDRIDPLRLDPYAEAISLEDPVDLALWLPRLAHDYPSTPVWLHAEESLGDPPAMLRRFHQARAAGVEIFFVRAKPGEPGTTLALNLLRALPSRFVVDVGLPDGILRFADPLGPERAALLVGATQAALDVGTDPVRDVRAFDLTSGERVSAWASRPQAEGEPVTVVMSPPPSGPTLVRYVVMRGPRVTPETVGVTDQYEMTAEEIIARERAFEAAQTRLVDHYQAKATISYHYRAETLGEAIDVASVNRFFWRGGVGEYQETELYVNGARWKGKPPSLPFIQAEKVKEVPLEIRLDESYKYRLEGKDHLAEREVWVIGFEPIDREAALYSGQIWIDTLSFARLKLRLVQHGLKEPITSNSDLIEYGEVPSQEGETARSLWLPERAYRQMVFTVLGRAVVAERRVTYEDFAVNTPEFDSGREEAYASDRPILRDDQTGSSYLVKDANGFRTVQTESLRNIAFFGGIGINSDRSIGTPFAGVNYFNFNWRNTGTQLDVAFAGPLIDTVWTDPGLGKSRWELSLEARLVGLWDQFHRTTDAGRIEEEDVKVLEENGVVVLSHPITPFQKASFQADLIYDRYRAKPPQDPNEVIEVPPPSGMTGVQTARWSYHRHGYLLDLWYSAGHRFSWADWGVRDPGSPAGTITEVRGRGTDTDFERWGLTALKTFYPRKLQTLSFGLSLFDGAGLDRFSRFRIGDFRNARVRGFNSRDLTFERGATVQVGHKFTLARGGASIEFGLEGAALENDEDFRTREYIAGGGAAVSINGPWGTLLSFRGSFGLSSSIGEVGPAGAGLRIVMIKTMDHWPRRASRNP